MKNKVIFSIVLAVALGNALGFAATNPMMTQAPQPTAHHIGSLSKTDNFSPYDDMTINTYWDSAYQDMEPANLLKASQVSGVTSYHLAFITDAGTCNPAWGGQASLDVSSGWGSHLTDTLRENSIQYIISFGGSTGSDISKACSESQLLNVFQNVIKIYQPEGLDFDIENGTADVAKIMDTLKQVQSIYPSLKISFTLPVMPEGLTATGENILNQAKANDLNYNVNIMAMDYGSNYVNNMGQYAVQAATNLFLFLKGLYLEKSDAALWNMIEVTPMIGVNDVNVEQFTLTDVDTLRDFSRQNNLGALSMWSIARDQPCSDVWASPTCSGDNLQSEPYQFAQRFLLTS